MDCQNNFVNLISSPNSFQTNLNSFLNYNSNNFNNDASFNNLNSNFILKENYLNMNQGNTNIANSKNNLNNNFYNDSILNKQIIDNLQNLNCNNLNLSNQNYFKNPKLSIFQNNNFNNISINKVQDFIKIDSFEPKKINETHGNKNLNYDRLKSIGKKLNDNINKLPNIIENKTMNTSLFNSYINSQDCIQINPHLNLNFELLQNQNHNLFNSLNNINNFATNTFNLPIINNNQNKNFLNNYNENYLNNQNNDLEKSLRQSINNYKFSNNNNINLKINNISKDIELNNYDINEYNSNTLENIGESCDISKVLNYYFFLKNTNLINNNDFQKHNDLDKTNKFLTSLESNGINNSYNINELVGNNFKGIKESSETKLYNNNKNPSSSNITNNYNYILNNYSFNLNPKDINDRDITTHKKKKREKNSNSKQKPKKITKTFEKEKIKSNQNEKALNFTNAIFTSKSILDKDEKISEKNASIENSCKNFDYNSEKIDTMKIKNDKKNLEDTQHTKITNPFSLQKIPSCTKFEETCKKSEENSIKSKIACYSADAKLENSNKISKENLSTIKNFSKKKRRNIFMENHNKEHFKLIEDNIETKTFIFQNEFYLENEKNNVIRKDLEEYSEFYQEDLKNILKIDKHGFMNSYFPEMYFKKENFYFNIKLLNKKRKTQALINSAYTRRKNIFRKKLKEEFNNSNFSINNNFLSGNYKMNCKINTFKIADVYDIYLNLNNSFDNNDKDLNHSILSNMRNYISDLENEILIKESEIEKDLAKPSYKDFKNNNIDHGNIDFEININSNYESDSVDSKEKKETCNNNNLEIINVQKNKIKYMNNQNYIIFQTLNGLKIINSTDNHGLNNIAKDLDELSNISNQEYEEDKIKPKFYSYSENNISTERLENGESNKMKKIWDNRLIQNDEGIFFYLYFYRNNLIINLKK